MSVVREITTLFDFKVDKAGFTQAEAAINTLKSSLISLGKLFGIALVADKIYEVVDEIISAGKEVNKLKYQLSLLARPGDDINKAANDLFETAQKTGVEYGYVLDTYKEFLNESKESNVSQDQLLTTVDNILTSMKLFGTNAEGMKEVTNAFNLGFRRGAIGMRQWGLIVDEAPLLVNALSDATHRSREELAAMAKAGKLTADFIVNGLGKASASLDEAFSKRIFKTGDAFTYARNKAVLLSARIQKLAGLTTLFAKQIVWLTNWVSRQLEALSEQFGGLQNTLEALVTILLIAVTPAFIKLMQLVAIGMARWIAQNFIVIAQYAAMAIAIAGIFLAWNDISVWMSGKGKSIIGSWLGPYDKFKEDFLKNSDLGGFIAPFQAFKSFLEGDFVGAWNKLKEAVQSTSGWVTIIIGLLAVAWIAWRAWNTLKFFGLIAGLKGIVEVIALISSGATEAVFKMIKLAKIGTLMRMGPVGMAAILAMEGMDLLEELKKGREVKPQTPEEKANDYTANGRSWLWDQITGGAKAVKNYMSGGTSGPNMDMLRSMGSFGAYPMITPGALTSGGATGAPAVMNNSGNSNSGNVNLKADVVIQLDPTFDINKGIKTEFQNIMSDAARQIQNSMPLVEAPTK